MTNLLQKKSEVAKSQWQIEAQTFEFAGRYVQWTVSKNRPDLGPLETFRKSNLANSPQSWLAGIEGLPNTPYECSDHVIRDQDLWLRYDEVAGHPIEFSLVFRASPAMTSDLNSNDSWDELECTLSMQTSSLDAPPYQSMRFQFPVANFELIALSPEMSQHSNSRSNPLLDWPNAGPAAAVIRQAQGCQLLVGFPGDWQAVSMLADATQLVVQTRLQVERMEKGVIRRLRCLSAFRPSATNGQIMEKIQQFQTSKLPLSF